ncbi:N-6 DNA methylase [Deinococcus oregonensis]|uniref:site-specific DNA-methyltransferase (adenine-specific) n=1 Tax=Deinococcus oregonensis TaxID=1805970 RepID=A0ABV6B5I3_9DEIO
MPRTFEDFRAALVRAYAQDNFYGGMSLTAYLSQPISLRSGDEMDIVDDKIAKPLLEALGFGSGDVVYNRTDKSGKRPDYLVRLAGYPRPPFVLEDKNTTENLDEHLPQLERYMLSHATPLGLICNGQLLRAYEMASGLPVMVAEFRIRDFVALERGEKILAPRPIEASLRAVYARCRNDAFSGTTALLLDLTTTTTGASHSESTWPAQARIQVRKPGTTSFLSGLVEETRALIREITWDVESQLAVRLTEYEKYRERQTQTTNRFQQVRQALLDALEKRGILEGQRNDFRTQIDSYFSQRLDADFIGTLNASLLTALNEALKTTNPVSAAAAATPTLLAGPAGAKAKSVRTAALSSLPTDVMTPLEQLVGFVEEYHATRESLALSAREAIAAHEAYRAWQSRVSLLLLPGAPEERLRAEFSAQTAYVMVVRMMLVRILEDKGIMSRVFTNGGVSLWFEQVEKRFLQYAQGQSTDFLLDLAYTSAQHIYSAFYSDLRLFDWYQPDRKMVIQVLHRLAGFDLSKIDHDLIGHMYARYVEDEHKHETGMYYTTPEIVEYMLDQLDFKKEKILGKSILDNACGSGTFLVSAARRIVDAFTEYHGGTIPPGEAQAVVDAVQEQIYGLDLNPFACYLAETNLLIQVLDVVKGALDAGHDIHVGRFNIYNTDTMSYDPRTRSALVTALGGAIAVERLPIAEQIKGKLGKFSGGFDFVTGNPPYVRADENAEMVLYRKRIKDLHPIDNVRESMIQKWDLSVPFIALGHHLLKPNGRMAIITSNSIENVPYAGIIREQLSAHQIDEVSFFPGVKLFEDAAVFNTMFFLTKKPPTNEHLTKRYWHNGKPPAYVRSSNLSQINVGVNVFRQDILTTQYVDVTPLHECLYVSVGMVLNADEKLERGAFKKDVLISPIKTSLHSKLYVEGSNLDAYSLDGPRYLEYGEGTRVPEKIRRATFPELYDRPKIMRGETSDAILDDGTHPDDWVYCNHSVILMMPWHSLSGVENQSLEHLS